ncbi:MAG: UDP-N-acetylmuramate dehydrogenase [Clostridia bacterium]
MWQKYFKSISNINLIPNESIKKYTTMKVGGIIKLLIISHSIESLLQVCKVCKIHNIKYKIIGLGANVIFSDETYNGVIIVNRSSNIIVDNNTIIADSGVSIGNLIALTKDHNLSGLEYFAGIPSTLGGAMINNLGTFSHEIGSIVEYIECYEKDTLEKRIFSHHECMFGYRKSIFQNNDFIITKVKLDLVRLDRSIINENIRYALDRKISTQPLDLPSAGSIFKRVDDIIPAKLIDELGLKGTAIGGAMISNKHAGFIVNTNNATADDIRKLINFVQDYVYKEKNVYLPLEVELVD